MRSIKSELYLFIKTLIMGGDYNDNGDVTNYTGVDGINYFMFWNNELIQPERKDNYPVPAVFLEFTNADVTRSYVHTSETNELAVTEDKVVFVLHVISPKVNTELREEDYLTQIDLIDNIYKAVQDKKLKLSKKIKKMSELQDNDSSVLMDWQMTFEVILINCGDTELVNANDPIINVNAPVEKEVNVSIKK